MTDNLNIEIVASLQRRIHDLSEQAEAAKTHAEKVRIDQTIRDKKTTLERFKQAAFER